MTRAIKVWLDEEAEEALAVLCANGRAETDAVRAAVIAAARRSETHPLVNDPSALEKAFDKSHDFIAEVQTTHRPPR